MQVTCSQVAEVYKVSITWQTTSAAFMKLHSGGTYFMVARGAKIDPLATNHFKEIRYYRSVDNYASEFTENNERLVTTDRSEVAAFFILHPSCLIHSNDEPVKSTYHNSSMFQILRSSE
ncbi:hypothetical protein X801_09159 [Opisthorchis viverrini]|uniref:Uncharacterized protein n=2 Tax=Opisthorchis viverrini TaxID=6198 RepID=A0A1S8WL27_OPIVI|nr:hypothetical protein T265_01575 [Opisthorchis viverrini]KER32348.1 hypothetical protein T265_01575 [Opisthorchis viverrini]OON15043.1 hypothetical protein X801_09159 [Opisthorchis viverrini]